MAEEPPDERREAWRRAALEAERETGRHEPDDAQAKASLVVRFGRISTGAVVTMLGLALLVLPGPGLVVVAAGLSILAVDVPFARRLLHKVRRRLPQDADGETPRWVFLMMGGGAVVGLSLSVAMLLAG